MSPRNKNRYLIFVTVAGAHALTVGVLLSRSGWVSLSSPTVIPITAFVLSRPATYRSPIPHARLDASASLPITETITLDPSFLPAVSPGRPAIDWEAQVKRSVARFLKPGKRIFFGFPADAESPITLGVPSPPSSHYAGEQYRTETGQEMYWMSDRCYMVSDPPSPFEPDVLKRARLWRQGCK